MYVNPNFRTVAELRRAVASGEPVRTLAGPIEPRLMNGYGWVEGPHYPEPHRWYIGVTVKNGLVVAVEK